MRTFCQHFPSNPPLLGPLHIFSLRRRTRKNGCEGIFGLSFLPHSKCGRPYFFRAALFQAANIIFHTTSDFNLESWLNYTNFIVTTTEMRFILCRSRTQAGPGRTVKEEHEKISPNHVQILNLISLDVQFHFLFRRYSNNQLERWRGSYKNSDITQPIHMSTSLRYIFHDESLRRETPWPFKYEAMEGKTDFLGLWELQTAAALKAISQANEVWNWTNNGEWRSTNLNLCLLKRPHARGSLHMTSTERSTPQICR